MSDDIIKNDQKIDDISESAGQKNETGSLKLEKNEKIKGKKAKIKKQVNIGNIYIKSTYNNTIVTISDQAGNVLIWSTAGHCGFKGPKKSTPYAASIIIKNLVDKIKSYGLKDVHVFVQGIGSGRESAIRSLNANGLNVLSIQDVTPIPHNGCKKKKPRRV